MKWDELLRTKTKAERDMAYCLTREAIVLWESGQHPERFKYCIQYLTPYIKAMMEKQQKDKVIK